MEGGRLLGSACVVGLELVGEDGCDLVEVGIDGELACFLDGEDGLGELASGCVGDAEGLQGQEILLVSQVAGAAGVLDGQVRASPGGIGMLSEDLRQAGQGNRPVWQESNGGLVLLDGLGELALGGECFGEGVA